MEKYLENKVPENLYERMLSELRDEEATLENKVKNSSGGERDIFEIIGLMAKFLKLAQKIFKDGDSDTKKEVLSLISSNLVIKSQKIFDFVLKEPFNWLYEDLQNLKPPKGENTTFEPVLEPLQKAKGAFAHFHPYLLGLLNEIRTFFEENPDFDF